MIGRYKILMWTYIPTHHQSAFLQALRDDGVDLVVHYFKRVSAARIRLGWESPSVLPAGERFINPSLSSLEECTDWRERIHIIPGYGARFLLQLALKLSKSDTAWVNWSEPSRYSPRWYLNYPVKRFYAALINRYALGALAIGEMARQDFVRWGVRPGSIQLLPYSLAKLEAFSPGSDTRLGSSARFMFVGALCHRKGIDILLRALRLVLQEHPHARLCLVGSDEAGGTYQKMTRRLGLAHAVEFMGSVPATHLSCSLGSCDVLVLPSRFDGWGMVINEAASIGKALIATDTCGAAHHLIVPEVNGFRVKGGDSRALANAMARYCREPGLAQQHGERSRDIFAEFTPARSAARLRACLASFSERKHLSSRLQRA